ncbi:MAG: hypothetical protein ACP5QK_06705 [Myxococcota bacterium]
MKKILVLFIFLISGYAIYSEEIEPANGDYEAFRRIVEKSRFKRSVDEQIYLLKNGHLAKSGYEKVTVFSAIEFILDSGDFSLDDKYSYIMDYAFSMCQYYPYKTEFDKYFPSIVKKGIPDFRERLKKELYSHRAKVNECYRKSVILGLGHLGDMDVTGEIFKLFDDVYWEFRESAVWAFSKGGHMKRFTKEEMKPYILKLNNDPYFERAGQFGCLQWKNPPIDPEKCTEKCKIYPVRDAVLPLLNYYQIKWKFDDNPCSKIGYGIRVIIDPDYVEQKDK